jgi:hypothetical protein
MVLGGPEKHFKQANKRFVRSCGVQCRFGLRIQYPGMFWCDRTRNSLSPFTISNQRDPPMLFRIFSVLALVAGFVAAETHTVSFDNKSVLPSANPGKDR